MPMNANNPFETKRVILIEIGIAFPKLAARRAHVPKGAARVPKLAAGIPKLAAGKVDGLD